MLTFFRAYPGQTLIMMIALLLAGIAEQAPGIELKIPMGDDGAGNQIGVSPGATWIGCRNMDEGVGTPATYTELIDFQGKAITVRSEHGPAGCIIDCQGNGRGFYFHHGETEYSVVQGFTIINGQVFDGG